MAVVRMRAGRVQPVWAGHPWIFAQAIEQVDGAPAPGEAVDVRDPRGNLLGRGFWSPDSAIPVRLITRAENEHLDEGALVRRIEAAVHHRRQLGLPSPQTDGYRLVHAEGDDLPGLVVDVFRDVAVVQLGTIGMKLREDLVFSTVARAAEVRSLLEVPSGGGHKPDGAIASPRLVRGPAVDALRFRERGFEFEIPPSLGQKTGYYFDQRDNRETLEQLARGRRVLDLYSFVGSFSLGTARGGASEAWAFDSSSTAVSQGATIAAANGLGDKIRFARGDVRNVLTTLIRDGERFDLVVVDPPKLAPTVRHLERAQAAYRRLNARAMQVLAPDGLFVSCSCSAAMRPDEFIRLLTLAARDAGRRLTLLRMGQQGMDHPVPAAFPEGHYLKCAVMRAAR
jgi:23S rRNA (cytosine1962-C5)-methyltransferase